MKTLKNYFSVCALVMCALFTAVSFSSCSDDDEESSESVTSSSLVDRTFTCDNSYVNDDGLFVESIKELTFTSSTQCSIHSHGYDWNAYYDQEYYNETKTCSYSVSGDKVTLHNYPFFAFDDDLVLTFHGSYLQEPNGNRWIED